MITEERLKEIENIAGNAPWSVLVELIAGIRAEREEVRRLREENARITAALGDHADR